MPIDTQPEPPVDLHYQAGAWGPEAAQAPIAHDGLSWALPTILEVQGGRSANYDSSLSQSGLGENGHTVLKLHLERASGCPITPSEGRLKVPVRAGEMVVHD